MTLVQKQNNIKYEMWLLCPMEKNIIIIQLGAQGGVPTLSSRGSL